MPMSDAPTGSIPLVQPSAPTARGVARQVAGDVLGAGLALVPLGLAFGLLVVHAGLDWWWAAVFAAFIYAGSLEFLLVGLVAASAPLGQIAITSLLVNSRHVFYALSFPLHRVRGGWGKAYSTYAMTDEAYAIAAEPRTEPLTSGRILGIQVVLHALWVLGAAGGALLASALSLELPGVEFALTALFLVLAIEGFRARRDAPTPLLAVGSAVVAMLVAPGQLLLVAMSLFTALLLVRYRLGRRREARA